MKRWFMLLTMILLLAGCGSEAAEPADTEEVRLPLTQWELPGGSWNLVAAMGDGLLLHDGSELVLLSADSREVTAGIALEHLSDARSGDIQVGGRGVSFYDRQTQTVCFLDENLQKISYIQLQGQVQGAVLLTADWSSLYYCTAEGVQMLDMNTGISRTLAYREENWLGVDGVFMNTMLSCSIQQPDGTVGTLIISTQTGQTVWETGKVSQLSCWSELYFGKMSSEAGEEWVFGWGDGQPRNFWPAGDGRIIPLLANDKIVTVQGKVLNCYDLRTGRCVAMVEYEGASDLTELVYLDGNIYFTGGNALYRWDLELTAVNSFKSHTTYRYTPENPDVEGLRQQQMEARILDKMYGVNIILWDDTAAVQPHGYEFVPEYIPENYPHGLRELENALDTFGRDFMAAAGEWTPGRQLNIILVREIISDGETVPGIQYILNGNVYIALALGDNMEQTFYHLMGHIIDIVVLSNSMALDDWSKLNPKDFSYDNDYTANLERDGSKYLQGDSRWFIDTYSMSFPVEDRATILEYAIMSRNKSYFASDAMQAKLDTLCRGIREAFVLTGGSYPWEQYLKEES